MSKWYLLPGMGANSSMYQLLREEVKFKITYLNWPKYSRERTFAEVAKRIIEENDIRDGDIVRGSSLGGMISAEVALQRKLRAVVLIGSATKAEEIRHFLSMLALLSTVTPISIVQCLVGKRNNLTAKMFAEADSEFMRAMCQYLPKWPGIKSSDIPLCRIHGRKDNVIPCPMTSSEIISNAGHFLAITHAKECAEFLNNLTLKLSTLKD